MKVAEGVLPRKSFCRQRWKKYRGALYYYEEVFLRSGAVNQLLAKKMELYGNPQIPVELQRLPPDVLEVRGLLDGRWFSSNISISFDCQDVV